MTKDYYKILDISEFSTQNEIKSAYRKLARKWHPDVAGNTPDVLARFKEINEAYEILTNNLKKADYDSARKFYNWSKGNKTEEKQETKGESTSTHPNFNEKPNHKSKTEQKNTGFSFNWQDSVIRKSAEKIFKREKVCPPQNGADICEDIEITALEAINGATKVINMLQTEICPKCGGRKFVNGTICGFCSGNGEKTEYKRFAVKIPAGIKDNSKIRLAGEGEKGKNGGRNGDLYLTIHIKEIKNYTVDGLNILKTIEISPYDAVLGANLSVSTPQGNISVNISPNTKNGQKIRLKGCGVTSGTKTGDMIVNLSIQITQNLSKEEIELYKKLRSLASSKLY